MSPMIDRILDEVRGAWRFRWMALAAAWALCLIGWIVVLSLPDMYQASARVFVDTRTVLRPLLEGLAINSDVDSQLNMVRQAMLGRPQLERVARETGLAQRAITPQELSVLIDKLRARIQIMGGAQEENRQSSGGLFVISYQDSDRDMSLKVVDKLLNTLVEGTLGGKREGSENARKFLREQIADYERRLSEAEQRLAEFKKRNVGLMPGGQGGDYFTRLQNEMDLVKQAEATLQVTISRRDELRRQLQQAVPFVATTPGGAVRPATPGQPGVAVGVGGGDTASRIQETQSRIDDLLLRFTERHPDVIAARETLEQLKQRQKEEIEALRRGDRVAGGMATNPVYQSIQLSLNQAEVEIAALRGQINDRQRTVKELRALVDTVPEVEAEFAHLNRDYDVTRAQYSALVDRLERARLSEEAEETGGILRFEVIDPPASSYTPVAPNRPQMLAMVLLLGLGGGGGIAYLLHWLRPVFNNARSLAEVTGLTVLGAVSMTWLDKRKSEQRVRQLAFAGGAAMLVLVFAGVFVFRGAGSQLLRGLIG
ncbi:MAG TPA: XrtA system polysaccharide chain length determinant [Steroidobacter sp.]|uniref:XrtA system polysaccharide chain length determinant n=1 Tax=Steroidobacter sp. TaxID=1978227 RepID=UPI002ED88696